MNTNLQRFSGEWETKRLQDIASDIGIPRRFCKQYESRLQVQLHLELEHSRILENGLGYSEEMQFQTAPSTESKQRVLSKW